MSIPECIFHKIMLYTSHPVADMFKKAVSAKVHELTEVRPGDHEYGVPDYRLGDDTSFADHYFHPDNEYEGNRPTLRKSMYQYAWMKKEYVETMNEFGCDSINHIYF